MSAAASTAAARARASDRRAVAWSNVAFAALLLLGVVFVFAEMRGLSFYGDEWDFLIDRRGTSAKVLLTPHNAHLSLLPILLYKAMEQIFGMRSYTPYKALAAADLMLLTITVGILARRRWGPWWGLVPVALLVTLGPGSETLLFPFQVGLIVATVGGLVALVAADRGGRGGDVLACAALCVSLASGSQGIGALAGALVVLALAPGRLRRAWWVIVLPALLYALWYLEYGHQANETHLTKWVTAWPYAMQALSSTISALLGLATLDNAVPDLNPTYGQPLALALLGGLGVALWRGWRPPRLFWGAVATLIVLWIASALSDTGANRPPEAGRYLPVDAAFFFLAAIAAIPRQRARVGVAARVLACVALGVVTITNAGEFDSDRMPFVFAASPSRAALGALLISRPIVAPTFNPGTGAPTLLDNVTAKPFFSAVDAFGTNAYTPAQLLRAPPAERELADSVLIRAERIGLAAVPAVAGVAPAPPAPIGGRAGVSGGCLVAAGAPVTVAVPAAGLRIEASPSAGASVTVSRFSVSPAPSGVLGQVAAATAAALRMPSDRAPGVPWRASVTGHGARICALPASAVAGA